ncbi:MAG: phosphatase [Flammeovirgaceae bacterium]
MKFAAIDIGSNAIRFQVSKLINKEKRKLKKVEYIRFPLRLGKDVFATGEISRKTEEKFIRLMIAFKQFLELYEVDDYMVCATSAMREAHNGELIANRVYYSEGVRIQILDGYKEGEIISSSIVPFLNDGLYIHVDVGGGSTELSLIRNKKRVAVQSFRMGSVRKLDEEDKVRTFRKIKHWLEDHLATQEIIEGSIGTGGNIRKLYELSESSNKRKIIDYEELKRVHDWVQGYSYAERISELSLNPDRADVIGPAAEIYLKVMEMAGAQSMFVPDVGLKDGIIELLMQKNNI